MLILSHMRKQINLCVKKNFSDGDNRSNEQSLKDIADGSIVVCQLMFQISISDTAYQPNHTAFEKFSVLVIK